jgi:hypothetical protein
MADTTRGTGSRTTDHHEARPGPDYAVECDGVRVAMLRHDRRQQVFIFSTPRRSCLASFQLYRDAKRWATETHDWSGRLAEIAAVERA